MTQPDHIQHRHQAPGVFETWKLAAVVLLPAFTVAGVLLWHFWRPLLAWSAVTALVWALCGAMQALAKKGKP